VLLARSPSPARAAKLARSQVVSALRAARRHHVEAKADALLTVLRAPGLRQTPTLEAAYAAVVVGQVGFITALNEQIAQLQEVVAEHFGRHPAPDIYLIVLAWSATNRRLDDALHQQAFAALKALTRCPGVPRRAPGQENRTPRGPPSSREPARRHPARRPQNRHKIRREHRLAKPNQHCGVTRNGIGCLDRVGPS